MTPRPSFRRSWLGPVAALAGIIGPAWFGAPAAGQQTSFVDLASGVVTNVAGACRLEEVSPNPAVTRAQPAVFIRRAAAARPQAAQRGDTLSPGDVLQTFAAGTATLRVAGGGQLRLAENSELRVVAGGTERSFVGYLVLGAARFLGFLPDDTLIQTPNGAAASHHTEYEVRVHGDASAEVVVFNGQVAFTNAGAGLVLDSRGVDRAVAVAGQPPAPLLRVTNIVQWWIHYPVVLNVDELSLSPDARASLGPSLEAYRAGRLRDALRLRPEGAPGTDSERVYDAALKLVVGDVAGAVRLLGDRLESDELSQALRALLGAVRGVPAVFPTEPETATGWMALSYVEQSRHRLPEALHAARQAVRGSDLRKGFGAGWLRVGELELGREALGEARAAIMEGRRLSPKHAQGAALEGFLLMTENRTHAARMAFEQAIALDASLANGWLGRALTQFASDQPARGIRDLETAVALEPERALLRSYLGKAFAFEGRWGDAALQLDRARELDPADPTPWLYTAVFDREQNRLLPAITNLARSVQLNDNRPLFRSREQLDHDESVRRANLAFLYRDAGLEEWSRWEAARAVAEDYSSADVHLFLAQSFAAFTDPFRTTLRFETASASEYLIANLLAPPQAAQLSPAAAFARPTAFFAGRDFEVIAAASARDPGGLGSLVSHQGHLGRTAYALDYGFSSQNRGGANTDLEQHTASAAVKQQVGPSDSLYFLVQGAAAEGGDARLYYDPAKVDRTFRYSEDQWPNLLFGLQHQWRPGQQTLALLGGFSDRIEYRQATNQVPLAHVVNGVPLEVLPLRFGLQAQTDFDLLSAEVQHLANHAGGALVAGVRFQAGGLQNRLRLEEQPNQTAGVFATNVFLQDLESDVRRLSVYAYEHLRFWNTLHLTLGLAYDELRYPLNVNSPPFTTATERADAVSPKVGLAWTPRPGTVLRGVYTRSLGGFSFDSSVRLEPTQVEGFVQAFRSLVPESLIGNVPGTAFETLGFNVSQSIADRVYATVVLEDLRSDAESALGTFQYAPSTGAKAGPSAAHAEFQYRESRAGVSLNVLPGRDLAFGLRYEASWSRLERAFPSLAGLDPTYVEATREALTHTLGATGLWQHPSGVFAQASATWIWQDNAGADAALPDEQTMQVDLLAGFRFPRRVAVISVGVLNLTDADYRLNPLGWQTYLPRERTLVMNASFSFW